MSEKMPWTERREIGPCTLYLGDCLALLAAGQIPTEAAIIADPPYGIGYEHGTGGGTQPQWTRSRHAGHIVGDRSPFDPVPWLDHAARNAKLRASKGYAAALRIALFGADEYHPRLPVGVGAWYTWDKACGGGPADSFRDSEIIWMGAKNARRVFRHFWKGRAACRVGEDTNARLHVSMKPVALMQWVIETVRTPFGSLVCDPYMGSGTTGIACLRTGRSFLGIEIDPAHYAVACTRIERAYAKQQAPTLPPSPVYP